MFSRAIRTFLVILALVFTLASGFKRSDNVANLQSYYQLSLDSLYQSTLAIEKGCTSLSPKALQKEFLRCRRLYKKIEFIVEYKYPSTASKINGAPIPESAASEPNETSYPAGFQVIEPMLFDSLTADSRKDIAFEISGVAESVSRLRAVSEDVDFTEPEVLDALRLNLYRMIIKGIAGFDAPVALSGIREAQAVLESSRDVIRLFKNSGEVVVACEKAIRYVSSATEDFNEFNRAVFIAHYINPLCSSLYHYQQQEAIPVVRDFRALSPDAETLFDEKAFDVLFFAPSGTQMASPKQIALGRELFFDAALSSNGSRSCGSCHAPDKAFTDGLKVNESLSGNEKLLRNTPTLWNAALQPSQFYDSRIAFLEDQIHDVISNKQEMNGSLSAIAKHLNKNQKYRTLFSGVYSSKQVTSEGIKKAIAAYVRSLVSLSSPFDRYMRGEERAMTTTQVQGFNLFMGKARCGSCHFIPLFSGAVPPFYEKIESEVLGVPASSSANAVLDADMGKYHLYKIPHQKFAFKTPSLRNVALTAPYMHNGVFQTMEQVIDFYDNGGGAGMGFDLPNQTLAAEKLGLTNDEKIAIIEFLKALSDIPADQTLNIAASEEATKR